MHSYVSLIVTVVVVVAVVVFVFRRIFCYFNLLKINKNWPYHD